LLYDVENLFIESILFGIVHITTVDERDGSISRSFFCSPLVFIGEWNKFRNLMFSTVKTKYGAAYSGTVSFRC